MSWTAMAALLGQVLFRLGTFLKGCVKAAFVLLPQREGCTFPWFGMVQRKFHALFSPVGSRIVVYATKICSSILFVLWWNTQVLVAYFQYPMLDPHFLWGTALWTVVLAVVCGHGQYLMVLQTDFPCPASSFSLRKVTGHVGLLNSRGCFQCSSFSCPHNNWKK